MKNAKVKLYYKNLPVCSLETAETMIHWNTDPLENTENTVIAIWFDKFEPSWFWDMRYNARWILTAKLNTIEQILNRLHLNLLADEGLLFWVCHLAFFCLTHMKKHLFM